MAGASGLIEFVDDLRAIGAARTFEADKYSWSGAFIGKLHYY